MEYFTIYYCKSLTLHFRLFFSLSLSLSLQIPIVDSYNELLNHTIQLVILNQNVPVFNQQQYTFTHKENNKPTVLGYILVGDLTTQQCAGKDPFLMDLLFINSSISFSIFTLFRSQCTDQFH